MPTKHIEDKIWQRVEKLTVHAVQLLERPIKDTEVLQWLVIQGLANMSDKELENFADFARTAGEKYPDTPEQAKKKG